MLEECEDSGTIQKEDVKTPAKMLSSTIHEHALCKDVATMHNFVVNDHM